jgi:hypothetical protein
MTAKKVAAEALPEEDDNAYVSEDPEWMRERAAREAEADAQGESA